MCPQSFRQIRIAIVNSHDREYTNFGDPALFLLLSQEDLVEEFFIYYYSDGL